MSKTIHPDTGIGITHLTVADLERSLNYYQNNIGLKLYTLEENRAFLGAGGQDLLLLSAQPGARLARRVTGLYHFALLLPSRLELARTLSHLIETRTPIGGFADHAVSEAIYLSDPDGHGIEIYRDRPRYEWPYLDGNLQMTTDPFDADGVLAEINGNGASWEGLHADTRMGHIHLHVSDLLSAEHFYIDVLGFEFVARYGPSALFVSAGGYHHHIGLNTWAGAGAPSPPPDALSLQWYEIRLPDLAALAEVQDRLKATDYPFSEEELGTTVTDPASNSILLTTHNPK